MRGSARATDYALRYFTQRMANVLYLTVTPSPLHLCGALPLLHDLFHRGVIQPSQLDPALLARRTQRPAVARRPRPLPKTKN